MPRMDIKEAAKLGRSYISDLYADEEVMYVGLEEVVFEHHSNTWKVTIGFARPWDGLGGRNPVTRSVAGLSGRHYKVIDINDETGQIEAIKDRLLAESGKA